MTDVDRHAEHRLGRADPGTMIVFRMNNFDDPINRSMVIYRKLGNGRIERYNGDRCTNCKHHRLVGFRSSCEKSQDVGHARRACFKWTQMEIIRIPES